jgi:hypothetical protein
VSRFSSLALGPSASAQLPRPSRALSVVTWQLVPRRASAEQPGSRQPLGARRWGTCAMVTYLIFSRGLAALCAALDLACGSADLGCPVVLADHPAFRFWARCGVCLLLVLLLAARHLHQGDPGSRSQAQRACSPCGSFNGRSRQWKTAWVLFLGAALNTQKVRPWARRDGTTSEHGGRKLGSAYNFLFFLMTVIHVRLQVPRLLFGGIPWNTAPLPAASASPGLQYWNADCVGGASA